jgi:hypothetical protein
MNVNEISRIARLAADAEACERAPSADKDNPIVREIASWGDVRPLSVRLTYLNRGGKGTHVEVVKDFGDGFVKKLVLSPDDVPQLFNALMAAQQAIRILNSAASQPEEAA